MGKTHTLLHIKHLCSQTGNVLVPIYAVMPNRPATFLDIYRAIVSELPFEFLGEQLVKVGSQAPGGVALHPMFARTPGLVNALLAMRGGEIERTIAARQWISAQPGLGARELRTINVTYRIKTAEDAIQALTPLTKLATFNAKTPSKLVVLLDEYQRIGELKTSTRAEINAGVHGYLQRQPQRSGDVPVILVWAPGEFGLSAERRTQEPGSAGNCSILTFWAKPRRWNSFTSFSTYFDSSLMRIGPIPSRRKPWKAWWSTSRAPRH